MVDEVGLIGGTGRPLLLIFFLRLGRPEFRSRSPAITIPERVETAHSRREFVAGRKEVI